MRQRRHLIVSAEWSSAIEEFSKELEIAEHPRSTRRLRAYQLRSFAHDHRQRGPWEITRADVAAWLLAQDWEPATRRSHRAALRTFYAHACAVGRLDADPTATLPKVKVSAGFPRPAPDDVVDAGLRTPDDTVRLAIWVMAMTGVRRAECSEINRDSVIHDLRGWTLRVLGKGGKLRDIPIEPAMARAILARPGYWAFPGQVDGHVSADWLGKLVARALPDNWTAHNLRHRFATLVYAETHDIRTVQELLGHARITTSQVYTLVDDAAKRTAIVGARRGLRISGAHMAHGARASAIAGPASTSPGAVNPHPTSALPMTVWLLAAVLRNAAAVA